MSFDPNNQTIIVCTWLPKFAIIDQLSLCIQTLSPVLRHFTQNIHNNWFYRSQSCHKKKASMSLNRGWAVSTPCPKRSLVWFKKEDRVKQEVWVTCISSQTQRGFTWSFNTRVFRNINNALCFKECIIIEKNFFVWKCTWKTHFNIGFTYNNWNKWRMYASPSSNRHTLLSKQLQYKNYSRKDESE